MECRQFHKWNVWRMISKTDEKEPEGYRERVRDAIQRLGVTLTGSKTGIPVGTLNKYVAMTSGASVGNVMKISAATGIGLEDIILGENRDELSTQRERRHPALEEEFVRVPVFDVKASAGHGRLAVSQMPVGEVAFAVDFLRRLGANPQSCYLLEARGDSMWPTVPDGAMLIVDASQTDVDDGRIYHFDVNERVLVKRARWKLGRLYLTSDNVAAGYPDESFAADRVDDIIVRGRIVFVGHAPLPMR